VIRKGSELQNYTAEPIRTAHQKSPVPMVSPQLTTSKPSDIGISAPPIQLPTANARYNKLGWIANSGR